MLPVVSLPLTRMADALAASTAMRSFVAPLITGLCIAASLGCTFFLVVGGMQYMSSRGKPEKLDTAKRTIKNALIGLALVIAAATLTAILTHAYSSAGVAIAQKLPALTPIQNKTTNFWDIVIQAIVHVLQDIISSVGQPFIEALSFFTKSTPLMGDNSAVFNMWLVIVAIADVLFVLVIALLGFHVMSFSALGYDELDIKQLLPQAALVFLLINTSIFAIDGVISLSNVMVRALEGAFPPTTLWDLLTNMTKQSASLGLGALLIMIAFLVLTVLLLIYYVGRLITLYIGAALSPVVLLLYLIPSFKDFAVTAIKIYLTTIFVLFVQVVIMQLASSIFLGMLQGTTSSQPNTLMALIVGLATVLALLKTQGVMKELSYASSTPRAAREMAGAFIKGFSYMHAIEKRTRKALTSANSSESEDGGSGSSNSSGGQRKRTYRLRTGETKPAASFPDISIPPTDAGLTPHKPSMEAGDV